MKKVKNFFCNIKNDKEFQVKDKLFKKDQSKKNYDNLIEYFERKIKKLPKNYVFMIADDDCVPMYSSNLKGKNNYKNYKSGKITFLLKECYDNLTKARCCKRSEGKCVHSKYLYDIYFEHLGSLAGVVKIVAVDDPAVDAGLFSVIVATNPEFLIEKGLYKLDDIEDLMSMKAVKNYLFKVDSEGLESLKKLSEENKIQMLKINKGQAEYLKNNNKYLRENLFVKIQLDANFRSIGTNENVLLLIESDSKFLSENGFEKLGEKMNDEKIKGKGIIDSEVNSKDYKKLTELQEKNPDKIDLYELNTGQKQYLDNNPGYLKIKNQFNKNLKDIRDDVSFTSIQPIKDLTTLETLLFGFAVLITGATLGSIQPLISYSTQPH